MDWGEKFCSGFYFISENNIFEVGMDMGIGMSVHTEGTKKTSVCKKCDESCQVAVGYNLLYCRRTAL
jgi:hypothetical protein